MRRPSMIRAGLALPLLLLLSACTPPETRTPPPAAPAAIDLLLTVPAPRDPRGGEALSVLLAERRGTALFFQEVAAAGPLTGIRLGYRLSRTGPGRPASPATRGKPAPGAGAAQPIVGRYVSSNPADRTALALRSRRLPTVSCGPGVPGKEMVSLAGLADGAAEKALSLLRGAGERRLTLFSDESPYGRRGRRVIARLARALGMRVRHRIFRTGGAAPGRLPRDALPIVAWLDRDGADALIRAARRAAYAGPILLGPAAAHPLLASVPGRKWPADRMRPPPGNPGEAILAVGHKLAVADALADGDPLKEKLERFRDVFLATFGRPPGVLSACAYDALLLLTESLYRVADPRAVRSMGARALPRVQARATFTGTLGTYRLTAAGGRLVWEGGLGESSYILLRARDGKWTPAGASGARLPAFRDPSFTPTRALPPSLKRLDGGSTTVPLNLRR